VAPSPPRLSDAAGEQGSVGGLELGTLDLAAEHGELVTQHQDLQVLGGVPAGEQGEQLDGAAQREGGEVRQHQVSSAGGAEAPPYQPLRPGTPAHSPRPSLRTPQGSNVEPLPVQTATRSAQSSQFGIADGVFGTLVEDAGLSGRQMQQCRTTPHPARRYADLSDTGPIRLSDTGSWSSASSQSLEGTTCQGTRLVG
jgi:hypothetical protein